MDKGKQKCAIRYIFLPKNYFIVGLDFLNYRQVFPWPEPKAQKKCLNSQRVKTLYCLILC